MKTKLGASFLFVFVLLFAMLAAVIPALPVLAAPAIFVSPSAGVSGTKVTVSGANFSSYSGDQLSIYFDNTKVAPNIAGQRHYLPGSFLGSG